MAEYALVVNGTFIEIKTFEQQPPDIPHKSVKWLPVVYENANFDSRYQKLGDQVDIIEQTRFLKHRPAANLSRGEMLEKVIEERTRRLALGFSYDFGDERGVHIIGTTEQDMKGWDEVTKAATSLAALGLSSSQFTIVTNTGVVTITAQEWLQIIVAATVHRQPIWAASFLLQAMDPVTFDYADDIRWP